jgi:hypothetical protein
MEAKSMEGERKRRRKRRRKTFKEQHPIGIDIGSTLKTKGRPIIWRPFAIS